MQPVNATKQLQPQYDSMLCSRFFLVERAGVATAKL